MFLTDETPNLILKTKPEDIVQAYPIGNLKAAGMAALKLPVDVAAAGLLIAGGVDEILFERDNFFKFYDEKIKPIQDTLTPEPGSVSDAGRFISGIAGFAPALLLGPAGIPVLAGQAAINTGAGLVEQGVGPGVATSAAILAGGTTAVMAGLPAGAPTWSKTLALAALNPVIGAASTQAEKSLLQAAGYDKIAEQYDPLDPVGRGIDSVLGLAFGAMGKYAKARQAMKARTQDSIDTVANWQRTIKDTPLAENPDLAQKAMTKAISDIASGKPVDLSGVLPDMVKLKTETTPKRSEEAEARAAIQEQVLLGDTRVPVPDNVFHRVGVEKGNTFADYDALYRKHAEQFADPRSVKEHVEYVLENPQYILPATKDGYTLLVRQNGKDKAAVVEFIERGGKYRVRSAYTLNEGQLERKINEVQRGEPNPIPAQSPEGNSLQGRGVPSDTLRAEPQKLGGTSDMAPTEAPPQTPEALPANEKSIPPSGGDVNVKSSELGLLSKDPVAQKVETRFAQEGDFPIHTGTDALGAPTSVSAVEFIGKAKEEYRQLEANQDIYKRISDCLS